MIDNQELLPDRYLQPTLMHATKLWWSWFWRIVCIGLVINIVLRFFLPTIYRMTDKIYLGYGSSFNLLNLNIDHLIQFSIYSISLLLTSILLTIIIIKLIVGISYKDFKFELYSLESTQNSSWQRAFRFSWAWVWRSVSLTLALRFAVNHLIFLQEGEREFLAVIGNEVINIFILKMILVKRFKTFRPVLLKKQLETTVN